MIEYIEKDAAQEINFILKRKNVVKNILRTSVKYKIIGVILPLVVIITTLFNLFCSINCQ